MASKNNPSNRKGGEVVTDGKSCEFCGSENGVHRVKYKRTMMWVCKDDNCSRHK